MADGKKKFGYIFNNDGKVMLVNTDCIKMVSVHSVMCDDWYFDVEFTDGSTIVACLTIVKEEIGKDEDYKAINEFMRFLGRLEDVKQY